MTTPTLRFGLTNAIEEGITTAWGARAILDDYGCHVLPDRMDFAGPREQELLQLLNVRLPMPELRKKVAELVPKDRPGMDYPKDIVIYEDNDIFVLANTQKSFGYVYLIALFVIEAEIAAEIRGSKETESAYESEMAWQSRLAAEQGDPGAWQDTVFPNEY